MDKLGFAVGHWIEQVGAPLLLLAAGVIFAVPGLPWIIERIAQ